MSIEQYKYYNGIKGFIASKSNLSDAQEEVLIKVSTSVLKGQMGEGNYCFTYAPVGTDSLYMLQKACVKGLNLIHGIHFTTSDIQDRYAVSYIGKLDMSHETKVDSNGKLSSWSVPRLRKLSIQDLDGLDVNVILDSIHVLLSSDRRVLLKGESQDQQEMMERYVSMILYLLPCRYANMIGFSVYPDELKRNVVEAEAEEFKSIRLIATSADVQLELFHVIMINANGRGNAAVVDDAQLHPYVRALKNCIYNNPSKLEFFKDDPNIIECFGDDGRIDLDRLSMIIKCQEWRDGQRDLQTAKFLLDQRESNRDYDLVRDAVIMDIVRMLREQSEYSDEVLRMFAQARRLSKRAEEEVIGSLVLKAFDIMGDIDDPMKDPLAEDLKKEAVDFVVRYVEQIPHPWRMFEDNEELSDNAVLNKVFAQHSIRNYCFLNVLIGAHEYCQSETILLMIAEYVKIEKTHNYSKYKEWTEDRLLEFAYDKDPKKLNYLAATVVSCYKDASISDKGKRRIERLVKLINAKKVEPTERIQFLIDLNDAVEKNYYITGKRNGSYLKTNIIPPAILEEKFIKGLTYSQVLTVLAKNVDNEHLDQYETLYYGLLNSFCNVTKAEEEVTLDKDYDPFISFFDENNEWQAKFRDKIIKRADEETYKKLAEHAEYLTNSKNVYGKIWEYRSAFTQRCWNCLFESHKKEVLDSWSKEIKKDPSKKEAKPRRDMVESILVDRESAEHSRKRLIEIIIDLYNSDNYNQIKGNKDYTVKKFFLGNILRSLIWGILAFVLLNLTSVISAVLLNRNVMTEIITNTFVRYPHHIVMVAWMIIVYLFSVTKAYYNNGQHRGDSKKSARFACVCLGLGPMFCYCLGYAIRYFVM